MSNQFLTQKAHALLLPFPIQSHITPMMQLAKRWASTGLLVSFVVTERNFVQLLRGRSDVNTSCVQSLAYLDNVRLLALPVGTLESDLFQIFQAMDKVEEEVGKLIQKINEQHPGPPVSCLVADTFFAWAQSMANKWGIPRVAVWFSNATAFSLYLHVPLLKLRGFLQWGRDDMCNYTGHPVDVIPGLPALSPDDIPYCFHAANEEIGNLMTLQEHFQQLGEATWVLINTCSELEGTAIQALQMELPRLLPVGPLLPLPFLTDDFDRGAMIRSRIDSSLLPEDDRCMRWLDTQAPISVLYVSFGSLASLSPRQLRELATGLEASQHPFLWVSRPGLVEDNVGDEFNNWMEGFVERTSGRGLMVTWAAQLLVLSHPAIGGFLSHCGWNSVLESICMGVPLLGWPVMAEQNTNCKLVVEEWKIGMRLKRKKDELVEWGEVERGVRRVMEGEEGREMRRVVGEVKARIRRGGGKISEESYWNYVCNTISLLSLS